MEKANIGETSAIFISRFMASWGFITGLAIGLTTWIVIKDLTNEQPLEVFNLGISLFTLFLDLIILRAAISLRNLDRQMMEAMMKIDKKILAKENETLRLLNTLIDLHGVK